MARTWAASSLTRCKSNKNEPNTLTWSQFPVFCQAYLSAHGSSGSSHRHDDHAVVFPQILRLSIIENGKSNMYIESVHFEKQIENTERRSLIHNAVNWLSEYCQQGGCAVFVRRLFWQLMSHHPAKQTQVTPPPLPTHPPTPWPISITCTRYILSNHINDPVGIRVSTCILVSQYPWLVFNI